MGNNKSSLVIRHIATTVLLALIIPFIIWGICKLKIIPGIPQDLNLGYYNLSLAILGSILIASIRPLLSNYRAIVKNLTTIGLLVVIFLVALFCVGVLTAETLFSGFVLPTNLQIFIYGVSWVLCLIVAITALEIANKDRY